MAGMADTDGRLSALMVDVVAPVVVLVVETAAGKQSRMGKCRYMT